MHGNRNPCNSFLMVKVASSMDHGRVRPTMTNDDDIAQHGGHPANTRSCTLGLKHMSLILDIHMMFTGNWQLSYQNIRWRVSHDHVAGSGLELIKVVFFFLSWPLTKRWFSIGSQAHVKLTCWKQGRIVRRPVFNFFFYTNVFCCFVLSVWWSLNSKQEAKQYTENLTAKLQNSNQNSTFS